MFEATARRRYGDLDREVVVEAVLRLALADNLENVSMRALAADLGTSVASLYYHVRDRGDLLDIATETVLSKIEIPPSDEPWDDQLRALFSSARKAMLPVGGIAAVLQSRPLAPSGRRLDKLATGVLTSAGLGRPAARAGTMSLATFLLGSVALEQALAAARLVDAPGVRLPTFNTRDFTEGLEMILTGLKYRNGL